MRLINVHTLALESFTSGTPVYAILSHTWIKGQEVTLQAMEAGGPARDGLEGWRNNVACCERAAQDGWRYVWVDTCCIDKTNSVELSEAINSMFRWYEEAVVCYAYLADVSEKVVLLTEIYSEMHRQEMKDQEQMTGHHIDTHNTRKLDRLRAIERHCFAKSRWFERGWTLQELLAPRAFLFFNKNWDLLGTRESLVDEIYEVTDIDKVYLLKHGAFRTASVATIFSWVARRETERIEDQSYSLLGLFGIHMPLIYGEGHAAFQRLQMQILQDRDDETIFAWHCDPLLHNPVRGFLAQRPAYFIGCKGFVPRSRDYYRDGGVMLSKGHLTLQAGLYKRCVSKRVEHANGDFVLITNCYTGSPPGASRADRAGHEPHNFQLIFCLAHDSSRSRLFHFSKAMLVKIPHFLPMPSKLSNPNEDTLFDRRVIEVDNVTSGYTDLAYACLDENEDDGDHTTPHGYSLYRDRLTRLCTHVPDKSTMIIGACNKTNGGIEPRGLVLQSSLPPIDSFFIHIRGYVYEPMPPMSLRIAFYPLDYLSSRQLHPNGPYARMAMQLDLPDDIVVVETHMNNVLYSDHMGKNGGPHALPKYSESLSVGEIILLTMRVPLPGSDKNKGKTGEDLYILGVMLNGKDPLAQYGLWSQNELSNKLAPSRGFKEIDESRIEKLACQQHIFERMASKSTSAAPQLPRSFIHRRLGYRISVLQWPQAAGPSLPNVVASSSRVRQPRRQFYTLCIQVRIEALTFGVNNAAAQS